MLEQVLTAAAGDLTQNRRTAKHLFAKITADTYPGGNGRVTA
jgi:hypothetical protein